MNLNKEEILFFVSSVIFLILSVFTEYVNDLIIVMWSTFCREDRWITNRNWVNPGNIFSQKEYDDEFVQKYADSTGYLIMHLLLFYFLVLRLQILFFVSLIAPLTFFMGIFLISH